MTSPDSPPPDGITTPPTTEPPTVVVAPDPNYPGVEEAIGELRMEEETVRYILGILDDAGRQIIAGRPEFPDSEIFGGSHLGQRMARHTAAAQGRVESTLYLALQAIASHHESLSIYRDEVHNVEADAQARLDHLRTIGPIAPPSNTVDA